MVPMLPCGDGFGLGIGTAIEVRKFDDADR
jgi:hypothetical protein